MCFNDIIGHEKTLNALKKQINQSMLPHAYLFVGPSGVGKKKTAVEIAKYLNCLHQETRNTGDSCSKCLACRKIENGVHPDVSLIDFFWQAALLEEKPEKQTQIKIDTIREIQKTASLKPLEGRCKVFILDDVQKISSEAANCLLKTLEEPPPETLLILLSSVKGLLPQTVVSRCQCLRFGYLTEHELLKVISLKSAQRKKEKIADFRELSKFAQGSAEKILSKFAQGSAEKMLSLVESDAWDAVKALISLWEGLKTGETGATEILQFIDRTGTDRKSAEEFISRIIVLAHSEIESGESLCEVLETLLQCRDAIRYNVTPRLICEVALLEIKNIFRGERTKQKTGEYYASSC